jgi:hypothetical protein
MAAKIKVYQIVTIAEVRANAAKARKAKAAKRKASADAEKKAKT